MPKNTFQNLNEDKKRRIFDAAVQEFSARRFSEASINQIIKNADIPKGSFYQYFSDKEDIYLYMLEEISKIRQEVLQREDGIDPNMNIFEIVMQRTKESLALGRIKPEYTKIGMLMEIDNSEFITKIRAASTEKYMKILERDKRRGFIKPEIDSELVINMILTFGLNEYFRIGFDENRYIKKLEDAIKIIKEGIVVF